jgi:hypothetical protein
MIVSGYLRKREIEQTPELGKVSDERLQFTATPTSRSVIFRD